MNGAIIRARRHVLDIERRLDALERAIRALEQLRFIIEQRSIPSPVEVLQED